MSPGVTLVTGGSRGIGAAVVRRLAAGGRRVAFTYRERGDAAAALAAEVAADGGEAHALQADFGDPGAVAAVFAAVDARLGRLDGLVLNAAVIRRGALDVVAPETFDETFEVNVRAPFLALRAAAERMSAGGRIVAISTRLVAEPEPGSGVYAASKAALETLSVSFAKQLGPRGIAVNVVRPGPTRTDGLDLPATTTDALVARTPMGRLGAPEDVAGAVALLLSDDAGWITGQVVTASGGL